MGFRLGLSFILAVKLEGGGGGVQTPPLGQNALLDGQNAQGCFLSHSHFKLIFLRKY